MTYALAPDLLSARRMRRLALVLATIPMSLQAQPSHPDLKAACEAGDPNACDELAVRAASRGDEARARALLKRADLLRKPVSTDEEPPAEPTPPPLLSAEGEAEAPPSTDDEVAVTPRPAAKKDAPVAAPPPKVTAPQAEAASSPFGIVFVGGVELAFAGREAQLRARPRVGMGFRGAVTRRPPSGTDMVPTAAATFVAGYAGLTDARLFTEGRFELVVNRPGGLFQPGFTLYAISGFDVHIVNTAAFDPYVGAGVGWNANLFKGMGGGSGGPAGNFLSGVGNFWSGSGGAGAVVFLVGAVLIVGVIILVPLVIAVASTTRVEFRYHPFSTRQGPPSFDLLLGIGF